MVEYRFGYMPRPSSLAFAGWQVSPLDQFEDVKQWVAKYAHRDGFLYPPPSQIQRDGGEIISNTERPAHLYRVPASHSLSSETEDDRTRAALVVQLLGFWYGTWLQFADWWFDARIRLSRHALSPVPAIVEDFLTLAIQAWGTWHDSAQRRFINSLYMFNRAPSYEWDWEHFAAQYMVLDSLYRTAVELRLLNECPHSERINRMCQSLGVVGNTAIASEFARLRNGLLHEAIWDGGQPGSAGSAEAFMYQFHLRSLNERLIVALLGYRNEFIRTSWWTLGGAFFDGLSSRAE